MAGDLNKTTTTSMNSSVPNFKVSPAKIDEATNDETYWQSPDWSKNLGYYLSIPELKASVDALVMWTCGKGWKADPITTTELEQMRGWGADIFDTIIQNMLIVKKVNGDSFAEIVRADDNTLINLKVLNPANIRIVVNKKGIIIGYDEINTANNEVMRRLKPDKVFHLSNDRIANQIHGTSVIEACKWVIDARNEAMSDKRRILHRSMIRVLEVDTNDTARYSSLKTEYANAIKNGEVMIVYKGDVAFPDVPPISTAEHSDWIRYLEGFFQKAVKVSPVILGGSQDFSEASSKIGMQSFEQPHMTERRLLEQDIWSQLFKRVDYDEPASLMDSLQTSEAANTGQTGFQPNNAQLSATRTE